MPPTITVVSLKPLTVRVSERVTVFATINGRVVNASIKPGTVKLAPKTVVKTLSLVARDGAGNQSAPITYPLR